MPLFYFQTFGCQMNVADSEQIRKKLMMRGFRPSLSFDQADIIIVNTCSVRENAEKRAMVKIGEFAKSKKENASLWVIGCMAERLGDKLKGIIPEIDLVIGAKRIDEIDSIIEKHLPGCVCSKLPETESNVTDFVPVMRGCNNYCTYCIVPYVRGPEHSIPAGEIENVIREKVTNGVKEITLLGQNVNSYNDHGTDFPDLLYKIAGINGLERIRFTTSHPKDCNEKLIRAIAEIPKMSRHVHLPVQAGSDKILKMMNRKYGRFQYLELVDMIKKYLPDADITTDIMVGFPGETDDDFRETLQLVRQVRYTTAFMFAYSVREGTEAASMVDSVPKEIKISRLNELISLQTLITKEIYSNVVGKECEVLITGQQKKRDRFWMGQDKGCKKLLVSCNSIKAGMILKVRAVRSSGMTLICERIV